jgi:glycosyltransferase involved in cell wall biosynthesis
MGTLPLTLFRLSVLLRKHDVRVVNVHYPCLSACNWVLLRKLGLFDGVVILSLHGLDVRSQHSVTGIPRRLWRFLLQGADHVVACSDGLRDEAVTAFDLPEHLGETIYNGIDKAVIKAKIGSTPRKLPPTVRRYLVNIGTFEVKKGQDVLIEAFIRIAPRFPTLDLVIAGRGGDTLPVLTRTVASAGLSHRVHFLSNLQHGDALRLVQDAEIFVLPSRDEGFSIAILEAAALGRPIVASDVCGVSELIQDGASGRVVPPGDSARLAEAIEELLNAPDRAIAMGENIRRVVEEHYSWRDKCGEYLALTRHL